MSTNKQRRESERQRLQRELQERRAREASRRRNSIIASVVGAIVLVAAVVTIILLSTGGSDTKSSAEQPNTPTSSTPTSAPTAACGSKTFPSKKYPAASGAAVSFDGVTITGAADLKGSPTVTSKGTADPATLAYKDLVVGKGAPATATSCVEVQYVGVQYTSGKLFDSSFARGKATEFPLTRVVPGFTQGIGGTTGVPPMKVGGRRIMILPSKLGYGAQANQGIPANSSLVFVVDLTKVG